MRIIDVHAHIYPEKTAAKASESIGRFYEISANHDGTLQTLFSLNEAAGIGLAVVHSVATVPEQVESINNFIAREAARYPGRLIGFAAMHPDYHDIGGEVERSISLGLRGMKIHPDFQRFDMDSPRAFQIYEAAEGRIPILVHTGDYRYSFSKAERVLRVLRRFPKLDMICAHFGGWSEWEQAAQVLGGERLWVDTSSSLVALTPDAARRLIDLYGVERVLFGTDYPVWNPAQELERFNRIELTPEERELILHQNAERLLGL